jgi:hypothetical protein
VVWQQLATADRTYEAACKRESAAPGEVPGDFNFAYDVVDSRAAAERERGGPAALLAVAPDGTSAREVS